MTLSPLLCALRHALAVVAASLLGVLLSTAAAQPVSRGLTAEQAEQDVRVLTQVLRGLHPALNKYLDQQQLSAAIDRFELRGKAARELAEMFLAASELAAAVRCGHTWTNVLNQSADLQHILLETPNKLPFTMTWPEGRGLVLASTVDAIAAGDEILAINGIPAGEIVKRLWPYLRADGNSDNKRMRQLGHDRPDYSQMDITWPLLSPPVEGRWQLVVSSALGPPRQVSVAATTLKARTAALAARQVAAVDEAWTFRVGGDQAVMTLPTFSFWRSSFDWASFITNSFAELQRRQTPTLIIDIRRNEGGDGAIGGDILSHLIRTPLAFTSSQSISAYERVPEEWLRYLDTWDRGFFDRTGQVERLHAGTAAGQFRVVARAATQQVVTPSAQPYQGQVFLLVGGENSSASFQFADLAQRSRAAVLVGEATGGNRRGLNGGQLAWVTLPHSGVAVDIPLLASEYLADTPDASVVPDLLVPQNFSARRAGRDLAMEAVQRATAQLR